MHFTQLLTSAATIASASAAALKGFNYGATNPDGSIATQQNFQSYFSTAQNLVGTSGFTSARLYTMIQGGTVNTPTSAIPAAIATKTKLLLGLWASAGQATINNELAALTNAVAQYGTAFTDLVVGISVGSEDLYRNSVQGVANKAGIGADPNVVAGYIGQTRSVVANTALNGKPIGHVDTWNDFVNGSNAAVIRASDFLGMDAYPYFEATKANSIQNGNVTFFNAYDATVGVAQGKPVWVTETGWPVSGDVSGQAVASVQNAGAFWKEVGCALFDDVPTFWYTLFDGTPNPSFGIVGSTLSTKPLFDLSCPA